MSPVIHITTSLGSSLIIVLIFINYIGKYNTDNFQRSLFFAMLYAALIAVISDFIRWFFEGKSGAGINSLLYAASSLYLITQNCTYYFGAVFIDYFARKNTRRSRKFMVVVAIFLALYSVSIIVNLLYGYYFTISSANYYVRERLFLLRLFLSYASVFLIMINMLFSVKYLDHSQFFIIILFPVFIGAGAAIDIMIKESNLTWPFFAAAALYMYFFIIQSDLKIDSLTRIGNRASFNDFIKKISRHAFRQDYAIVMMDMDKFKEINDTLGHLEGDNALRDMAAIIKRSIRHSDFAARYGGDEFVIAARADSDIQKLIDRILDTIDQQNERQIRPYQLYISYGYDVYKSGESISDFIAKIDAMMYKQKEERKSRGLPSSITSELPNYRGTENNV